MEVRSIRAAVLGLVLFGAASGAFGAKILPVNEVPGQVPGDDEEARIWAVGKQHQQMVRQKGQNVHAPELELYLEGIVQRLMGDMVADIGLEIDVIVFPETSVNAWAYPDGTLAVQTGLLAALENEAQLAAILGHEVSHYLNRHAYQQLVGKKGQSLLGKGLGLLTTAVVASQTGVVDPSLMQSGQMFTELVTSGYSRSHEVEADEQGLMMLAAAHYEPEQALPAFDALRIPDDDEVNFGDMWSSHPDIDSRLKNLSKDIKTLPQSVQQANNPLSYYRAVGPALLANAELHRKARQYGAARADLTKYVKAYPKSGDGYYRIGETWRKEAPDGPDFTQRNKAYLNAISVDPQYAVAYKELGMAHRQQGNKQEAIGFFTQYLELAPDAADAGIIRAYIEGLR